MEARTGIHGRRRDSPCTMVRLGFAAAVSGGRMASGARPEARAYLLTARGFGRTRDSQAWVQLELVLDGEKVERHWRRVAARPF